MILDKLKLLSGFSTTMDTVACVWEPCALFPSWSHHGYDPGDSERSAVLRLPWTSVVVIAEC